jgi:protein-tyrosine phosphatase
MARILVICTANICRSPVAAALLRDRLRQRGLGDWTVSSAGTWATAARPASRYSVDVMGRHGFNIADHRATMVEERHLREADLALTMEDGHAEALRAEFPTHAHKVFLLTEMVGRAYNIPDPYGGPIEEYQHMYDGLVEVIDAGLDRIIARWPARMHGPSELVVRNLRL